MKKTTLGHEALFEIVHQARVCRSCSTHKAASSDYRIGFMHGILSSVLAFSDDLDDILDLIDILMHDSFFGGNESE